MTDTSTPAGPPPGSGPQTADGSPAADAFPPAYGPPPPPRQGSGLDDLFARLRGLDVRRDTDRRWFGGVCAGLAARFGVDPLLIRAGAIALTIAGGLGIGVYLVLWLLLPDRHETVLAERAVRHGDVWPILLVVLTGLFLVGSVISVAAGGDGPGGPYWLLVPVGLVVWILATRSRPDLGTAPGYAPPPPPVGAPTVPPPPGAAASYATPYGTTSGPTPSPVAPYGSTTTWAPPPVPPAPPVPLAPPPPPRPRRRRPSGYLGLVSLGVAVALGALGAILAGPLGFPGEPAVLGFTFALAGVSAIVLGLALSGRASGFSGFVLVVLAALTTLGLLASHSPAPRDAAVGERTWSPSPVTLPASYSLGAGEAVLDLDGLTGLTPAATGTPPEVRAELGAGRLTIDIPAGLTVSIESHTDIGEIRHERVSEGTTTVVAEQNGDDRTYRTVIGDGDPDVVVRTEVGFGDTVIEEN